ncbi:MAG: TlpA family protein disulfide reductase [Nitrospinae bacterium]|nr:TlpA family protein disulfide reductase [Nitrospinota bacterium]MBF0633718.1 TlpA family protein disulfide reductase [Nitrospinota bacterium]
MNEPLTLNALTECAPLEKKSTRRINHIVLLGAFALILNALFNHFTIEASNTNKMLKVGDRFPAYSLTAMDGSPVSGESFLGRPTVYFFFADWCPCSHDSIKWIKRMQAENSKTRIAIMGVGILDSSANIARFAKAHKLEFPVVTENGQSLAHEAGMEVTPTAVFVDADGVIRYVHVGKLERYEQALEGLKTVL